MKKNSVSSLLLIAVCAVVLMYFCGLLRDLVFITINKEMPGGGSGRFKVQPFSPNKIIFLKWALTAAFTIVYFAISFFVIKILFQKKNFLLITSVVFSSLFIVSLLISVTGFIIGKQEIYYRISRDIMGLVQSPFLLMVLIPAFYLVVNNQVENKISTTFDAPDEERKK